MPCVVKHREITLIWINRLLSPEFNIDAIKDNRNRHMLMLCLFLINDENDEENIFKELPKLEILFEINTRIFSTTAKWEMEYLWFDEFCNEIGIDGAPDLRSITCHIHQTCPTDDMNISVGQALDRQFRFFLYLVRSYALKLPYSTLRLKAAIWFRMFRTINDHSCAMLKGIRNDYMMLLLGYISNEMLIGPFQKYPENVLLPLCEVVNAPQQDLLCDTPHAIINGMLANTPKPIEGAFAIISIGKHLYDKHDGNY